MKHRHLHALAVATALLGGCATSTSQPPAPVRPLVSQIVIETTSRWGPREYWAISDKGAWYHQSASGPPNAIVTTETRFTPATPDANFAAIRASLASIEALLVPGIPCAKELPTDQDNTEIDWYGGVNHSSVGWYWGCQSPTMDAVKATYNKTRETLLALEAATPH